MGCWVATAYQGGPARVGLSARAVCRTCQGEWANVGSVTADEQRVRRLRGESYVGVTHVLR